MSDSRESPPEPALKAKPLVPRDAATLILARRSGAEWTVLMGQRSNAHVFMPNLWVFPGGAVDRSDAHAPAATELTPTAITVIGAPEARARALALAAIRETFEETGLIVGRRCTPLQRPVRGWEQYTAHGATPELHKLSVIGRAITPPARPRRYDARFFLAHAEDVLIDERPHGSSEELLLTRWFSIAEALELDLPMVTRFMLNEARARLVGEDTGGAPFMRWWRGRHVMDRI